MTKAYFAWKELFIYEENGNKLIFEAPAGVTPVNVYVPSAKVWTSRVPEWAKFKRQEILTVIGNAGGLGLIIEDESAWVDSE